jgi:hypothetical protein
MKNVLIIPTALLTLGLAGCATATQVSVTPMTSTHYAPLATVAAYTHAPTRAFLVIARLKAQGPAGTPSAQILASLEKRAASLGADAVIIRDESRNLPAQIQFNPSGGRYTSTPTQTVPIYSAEAIRWKRNP